ncbi:MAG: hypothetical protein WCY30_07205 [Candidatus Neomarinimicrobiota bacterium]|jgi:hypothetical protein
MSNNHNVITVESNWLIDNAVSQEICRLADEGENGIYGRYRLSKTPGGNDIIVGTRQIARIGSKLKDPKSNSQLSNKIFMNAFPADEPNALYDHSIRSKVQDVVLPFKEQIVNYGPLSDIISNNMKIIVTDEVLDRASDGGVDMSLLDEEMGEVKSVNASSDQVDLASNIDGYRRDLLGIIRMMGICRQRIIGRYPGWVELNDDLFLHKCATEGIGADCAEYLKMEEKRGVLKRYIDKFSSQVISTSLPKIYIPDHLSIDTLRFPTFNSRTMQFDSYVLTLNDIQHISNNNVDDVPLPIDIIPELDKEMVNGIAGLL